LEVAIDQRLVITKLGEQKSTEERSWSPGEPLMDPDDGAIALLYLLLALRQLRDKWDVESGFYHRRPFSAVPNEPAWVC
jgi:hypothetical protein